MTTGNRIRASLNTKRTGSDRQLGKAKVLFEQERDNILARIPDNVKRDYLKLGFAKLGASERLPVEQLSPFQLPQGSVRDQWVKMFNNVSWLALHEIFPISSEMLLSSLIAPIF